MYHPPQDQDFGAILRMHRLLAGLTQEELAARAELSARAVIYLESGRRRPQAGTLGRLTTVLQLTRAERIQFARLVAAQQQLAR